MIGRSPYYKGNITASEIKEAYEKAFGVSFWNKLLALFTGSYGGIQLADQAYKEADVELIQLILDADVGDKEEYVAEDFDCDDFAFALMGVFHKDRETAAMPIFITWVSMPEGGHAVLSYYSAGEVKIIEPQTDDIFPVPDEWGLMLLCG